MNPWMLLLSSWGAMALVMTLMWMRQRATGNAGIVDVVWAAGMGALAIVFALVVDGHPPRRVLVAALGALWALRLTWHLFIRVVGKEEDGRYAMLREEWGDSAQGNFFAFFQVQAAWTVLFAVPFLLAARGGEAELGLLDAAGAVVWLIAVVGEAVADRQLARFRNDPSNRGKVCKVGLWSWSRHPNYFFEWVHWWAYVLIGISAPWGWLTLMGPALMLLFLLRVTGIPYTEKRAVASRGDAYREYQKTVSAFVPLPPSKQVTSS